MTPLHFDTLSQLRDRMAEACPLFVDIGHAAKAEWIPFGKQGDLVNKDFMPVVENFYMTDPICRASPTMAKCTAEILPLTAREAAE
jgi:NADH-quinone oxidoreductase subunit G